MTVTWRKVILYLSVTIMELCWIYALMTLLNGATKSDLSVIGLVIVYPIAFGASLMLHRLKLHKIALTTINWVIWAIIMLLTVKLLLFRNTPWADSIWLMAVPRALGSIFTIFRAELIILIGTAILWWFGGRLSRLNIGFRNLVGEFQFGLPIMMMLFVIAFVLDIDIGSIPLTLLFFCFALLGFSISHPQEGNSWLSGIYRGHWLVLLIISIVVVIGLGLLIGSLINHNFIQLILIGLNWVWNLLTKILDWLISLIPLGQQAPLPPPEVTITPITPGEGIGFFHMSEQLRKIFSNGWAIVTLGLFVLALWRISVQIYGWLRKRGLSGEAEIETVRGSFKADLLKLLWWFARLFRIRFPQRTKPPQPEVVTVRHLYRQLLRWAAAQGLPRKNTQTPDEYLAILVNQLPSVTGELNFITKLYNGVRYGNFIPQESELNELRQDWHRIKVVRIIKPIVEPISV